MEEKKVMKKSDDVVAREIEGKVILMPLRKSSMDLNYIYTLNETASCAWDLFDGKSTLGEIRNSLCQRYEVTEGKVEKELTEFVKDLRSIKAIF
jgi:hypothetical protein